MFKARFLVALGLTMSLSAFGYQQPDSSSSSQSQPSTKKGKTDKTGGSASDTGSRSRVGEPDSRALLGPDDQKFVMDAARGGMLEVQLGQTAQQKASSQAVKDFGKRMEQDHTQVNKELADLAKSKNVSLPTDMGNEKSAMDKISNQSGAAFDKAYMKSMVRDHRKDLKEFEHESTAGMDSDVKAFAAKTLPMLREHLKMAEDIEKNLGKGGRSSKSGTSASSTSDASSSGTTSDTPKTPKKEP